MFYVVLVDSVGQEQSFETKKSHGQKYVIKEYKIHWWSVISGTTRFNQPLKMKMNNVIRFGVGRIRFQRNSLTDNLSFLKVDRIDTNYQLSVI